MKKFARRKCWKIIISFSRRHRISRVICSATPIRVSRLPKLCSFICTTLLARRMVLLVYLIVTDMCRARRAQYEQRILIDHFKYFSKSILQSIYKENEKDETFNDLIAALINITGTANRKQEEPHKTSNKIRKITTGHTLYPQRYFCLFLKKK